MTRVHQRVLGLLLLSLYWLQIAHANELATDTVLFDSSVGTLEPLPICKGMDYPCGGGRVVGCVIREGLVAIRVECSMSGDVCCEYVNRYYRCRDRFWRTFCNMCETVCIDPKPGRCRAIEPPIVENPGGFPPYERRGVCQ